MTTIALTRRQLARIALAGAAGSLLTLPANAQNTEPPMTATNAAPDEGPFLAEAVPLSAGYTLTKTQSKEVSAALKDYPAAFGKARTYPIPDDISPAWTSTVPPVINRKERGR